MKKAREITNGLIDLEYATMARYTDKVSKNRTEYNQANEVEKSVEPPENLAEIREQNSKFHEKLFKLNRTMHLLSKTVDKISKKVNAITNQSSAIHEKVVGKVYDENDTGNHTFLLYSTIVPSKIRAEEDCTKSQSRTLHYKARKFASTQYRKFTAV